MKLLNVGYVLALMCSYGCLRLFLTNFNIMACDLSFIVLCPMFVERLLVILMQKGFMS